jgi:hypothetical protein
MTLAWRTVDMRFAPRSTDVDCQDVATGAAGELQSAAECAAASLERHGYAVFRIGRLRMAERPSRALAGSLMAALRAVLVIRGAPPQIRVEVDEAQTTIVPAGVAVRTMLPHHDGQHAAFLTPSRLDMPDWRPQWRTFSDDGYTTTHSHKLYQAIFVVDPGEGLSVTTVYDLLSIVHDAALHGGVETPTISELARWVGANLRAAHNIRRHHGSTYPTLAGLLGLPDIALQATALIRAEATLGEAHLRRHGELRELIARCPCGTCAGETLRVFCHVTSRALGQPWPQFRASYETWVVTERFDLLVTHNLTMNHGGVAGGTSRTLEPTYLSVERADGEEYEIWLSAQWRQRGQNRAG